MAGTLLIIAGVAVSIVAIAVFCIIAGWLFEKEKLWVAGTLVGVFGAILIGFALGVSVVVWGVSLL
tara:strand:- start:4688 stop:4885 length:198 start_codon:yes stop_codon:yes gene_type:complete